MKTKLLPLLLLLLLSYSCDWFLPRTTTASEQEQLEALKKVDFDKNIIMNLKKYEALKIFLTLNIDTIMAYRNSKNKAEFVGANGKTDSVGLIKQECYSFQKYTLNGDLEGIPPHLRTELKELWDQFSDKQLSSFTICDNCFKRENERFPTISMVVYEEGGENHLFVYHQLFWQETADTNNYHLAYIQRDTMLTNECKYSLVVWDDVFW